jgi:outer membrane receptor for ferrienterochelin and colicins
VSPHTRFEARLKAQALGLGFDLAGIASLGPVGTHGAFARWLDDGRHGTMEYLARGTHLRADTTRPEPGMRSALVVALDYGGRAPTGPVARYARGDDYHRLMWDRLEELLAWVKAERGEETRGRAYVDTGPILERDLARKAGLGWFGKNTMLINPERGSFFFLGALFLDADLTPDAPFAEEHCGSCTRCLDACPTQALVAPGQMDARRCISYLTIERRGALDEPSEAMLGDHIYGCDICQDVCPWNVKFAQELKEPAFAARAALATSDAAQLSQALLAMDDAAYRETFRNSAMKRAKLEGLKRNARAVLRNLGRVSGAALFAVSLAAGIAVAQEAPKPDSTQRDSTRRIAPMVIGATRSPRRVEDEPVRVEVLGKEEVEEKLLMTPGDITMMLNETSGLRVQTTSQSMGAANLRIQGLRGRYTLILSDGLPLAGAQSGSLSLLQIPPMDLAGVEILKGVSSALYGGSALGGVVNLVSRRVDDGAEQNLLANGTSLGGTDLVSFTAKPMSDAWDGTLLLGLHNQPRVDRDNDNWSDVAGYSRQVVRPRAFWHNAAGHSVMLTGGLTLESRDGGTEPGEMTPDGIVSRQSSDTERFDFGMVGRWPVGNIALSARGSAVAQKHRHRYDTDRYELDHHRTYFAEAAASGYLGRATWVAGIATQTENYENESVAGFDYVYEVPGVFAQLTADLTPRIAVTASARSDFHSEYGTQFSPRISALWKLTDTWSLRASGGEGYFAPTPLTEEVEVVGIGQLDPLVDLVVESATNVSFDLGGAIGGLEIFASLFQSRINDPIATVGSFDTLRLRVVNMLVDDVRTRGAELMLRARPDPFHVSFSYTRLRSTEGDHNNLGFRRPVPLTPNETFGLLFAFEEEDRMRFGLEVYYTGPQSIPDDPDRATSPAYTHIGLLTERRIGPMRVFVNVENLLNVRMTSDARLTLPDRGLGGRWTRDVWGPVEGLVFNAGVRF